MLFGGSRLSKSGENKGPETETGRKMRLVCGARNSLFVDTVVVAAAGMHWTGLDLIGM